MELKIGTLLTLEPTYTDRIEKFRCRVVDRKANVLFIDYPINVATKKTAFLVDGAQFRVTYNTESKLSYSFNTEVLGRRAGNIQMILISCPPPEGFIKIQRREYVRVETPVDVAIEFDGRRYQFVAEDISAGGTAIHIKSPVGFNEGDVVKMMVVLPFVSGDIRYVETDATIIRIFEKDEVTIASIQFTDTDELDQQHIVRFCFERQLMIRKKETNEI
ncbi:glycosyltransferase [Lysinibacillus sp. 2017]|uniref:flagellar brake protein n=1 Tax=unclassified Lysinibacillus TaxID=2636778 RepID=UPI000D529E7D|nr:MULTISPECIES: flagellar brake domain-containing protein [unclassified Lysinibacillus]AWE06974.1 glycosyltransferase [Lysinibacillus sp. 2017]TGN37101.1 glycosyltransferase [Lysinibacillus sp. S2017]